MNTEEEEADDIRRGVVKCAVCGKEKIDGKSVVYDPSRSHIDSLLTHAKSLVEKGCQVPIIC